MEKIDFSKKWQTVGFPPEVENLLANSPKCIFPKSRQEVLSMAMGGMEKGTFEVKYEVPGMGTVVEATVTKCKNGLSVNYPEAYMRRRDPECMVIADEQPTDKTQFVERFGTTFTDLRQETFDWLEKQNLVVMPFMLADSTPDSGMGAVLIAPDNAGFFIGGLGDLQGMIPCDEVPANFKVKSIIYLAPPFRHTHFEGKQVVVHNRLPYIHEVFAYNLYPGPSAKKGVYGILLSLGATAGDEWLTLHGATVQVVTPYDNVTTIMHEGASGSGKSEMLERIHRLRDGRLLLGNNTVTKETRHLVLNQACDLRPVTDDMARCAPVGQHSDGYLLAGDAEKAWFLRVNHIDKYGTDHTLESLTIHPTEPLIFLNMNGVEDSTCLIWEHTEDHPGKPCPNPRVILPRQYMPEIVNGMAEVMIRSFGIRMPACTSKNPTYGIAGYLNILPGALAWIWRLVSPRGHDNPSITATEGMTSEGVGSYWPFAAGRMVDHANLLLRQMLSTPRVRYVLIPNQHVGAWNVGFMTEWVSREYLARRGTAKFMPNLVSPARCPLMGYALNTMQIEGTQMPEWLLRPEKQRQVGEEAYDKGAKILQDFFVKELQNFLSEDLDPLGRKIIECCLNNGTVADYENLMDVGSVVK
ncbi:MAG: DUF4914 family protein [Phycisphaerae bacterium]|nr:DUF4914 family protein [Phycisphaerae bacterium]